MEKFKLDADSQDQLDRRAAIGGACLEVAQGSMPTNEEDRETAASDAISDILTALYGPAGVYDGNGIVDAPFALNEARRLIEHAYTSYTGDAEGYCKAEEEEDAVDRVEREQAERDAILGFVIFLAR